MTDYPRPDFVRSDLTWESLNGPWYFLFDDEDVGLSQHWHLSGLPHKIPPKISPPITEPTNTDSRTTTTTTTTISEKREIQVPYVFQCAASGINEKGVHEVLWYERNIQDPRTPDEINRGHRVLLRFGAVDYEARIWVGGLFVGDHRGGHVPFDLDVSDAFVSAKEQSVVIRVFDSAHDLTQPRGKQYWKPQSESIFYTPSSGIWQSVWVEVVPGVRIGDASQGTVLRSDNIEGGKLAAEVKIVNRVLGVRYSVEIEVGMAGVAVGKSERHAVLMESDSVSFAVDMRLSLDQVAQLPRDFTSKTPLNEPTCWHNNVALWSPEHPTLYDLTIRLYSTSSTLTLLDTIRTTTGMRSLTWHAKSSIHLNNRPYFQALLLDQGYWPSTFLTPPSPSSLKQDIELSKAMGFNGCRKHQKVEDPVFHYWADRLGFLVWGEMASAYAFSAAYMEQFDQEWREAVRRDVNHPCVVAWTPVNESWGYPNLQGSVQQRDHIRSLYYTTKALDSSRPVNDNCGWEHVQTDLSTFHDYTDGEALTETCRSFEGIFGPKSDRPIFLESLERDLGSKHQDGAPILCTEFGGINIAPATEEAGRERDWGYTTAADSKDLLKRIEKMMMGIVQGGHICGFVYTQLTDIEQEVNGLYTIDRKAKLDTGEVKKIVEKVREKFAEKCA